MAGFALFYDSGSDEGPKRCTPICSSPQKAHAARACFAASCQDGLKVFEREEGGWAEVIVQEGSGEPREQPRFR